MEYKLERSKRKTLSIVIKDGCVIVKAPNSMSKAHIDEFVRSKQSWIEKKLREYSKKADLLAPVMDYSHVLVRGVIYPLTPNDKYKRVRLENGKFLVPNGASGDELVRAIGAWYRRTAVELESRLKALADMFGLSYSEFALTNAKGKWGSCDGKNRIRLNWRLVMLDDATADYVIIHELCHTLHHDHSAAFWAEVKKRCGYVAAAKKRLKMCSTLISLYR